MDMVGKSDVYHANNSSFGTQRYESYFFPLLYVSNRCGLHTSRKDVHSPRDIAGKIPVAKSNRLKTAEIDKELQSKGGWL